MNNPVRFSDPTGHMVADDDDGGCFPCTPPDTSGGGNPEDDLEKQEHVPRSTEMYDFQIFSEVQWFTGVNQLDRAQMQQFCSRNFGPNVECGLYKSPTGDLSIIVLPIDKIDAIGIRIEGSGWLGAGGDLNIDLVYFGRSNETGLFATPGGQGGAGGGAAITGGILIASNMPSSASYVGSSYTVGGGDLPIIPLGISVEGDMAIAAPNADGSTPTTLYLGAGPLQPEISTYSGAGYTIPISGFWNWITGK